MSLEKLASIPTGGRLRSKAGGWGGRFQKKGHNQQDDIVLVYQNILTCLVH